MCIRDSVDLTLHEGRKTQRRFHADVIGVFEIRFRDRVGHVRRELPVRGAVRNSENEAIRRPNDFQIFQLDGRVGKMLRDIW